MNCRVCGTKTHDWFGDAWCDACHGVQVQKGDGSYLLLFRHVANVRGPYFGLPIVWDESAQHYLFRWPNKLNPRYEIGRGLDDDMPATPILSSFGPLDAVLALALGEVRKQCEGNDVPELSASAAATAAEREILRL